VPYILRAQRGRLAKASVLIEGSISLSGSNRAGMSGL
jgi:hypothetical protein